MTGGIHRPFVFGTLSSEITGGTIMWRKLLGMALLLLAGNSWAGSNDVLVGNAWLRESVAGQKTASLQLNLTVTRPGMLLKVSTPYATAVQIQRVVPRPGKVIKRVLRTLRLSHASTVVFGERGLSLMLVGLKAPLSAGSRIPVTVLVRLYDGKLHKVETTAEVRPLDLSYRHYEGQDVYDH
jgi:periplasmic copper chaperone A